MTYKNTLAILKSRAPEDKILLGGAWTKQRHPYCNGMGYNPYATPREKVPNCGCALAELVPGLLNSLEEKSYSRKQNPGFNCLFGIEDESLFNGMTYKEAEALEGYNDRCLDFHDNTLATCRLRAQKVEAWLEDKVSFEANTTDLAAYLSESELASKTVNVS